MTLAWRTVRVMVIRPGRISAQTGTTRVLMLTRDDGTTSILVPWPGARR